MLKSLSIEGLRGFAAQQSISFAVPNGRPGSGLTILVGPNGGGKTTIIEALALFSVQDVPSVAEAHRSALTQQLATLTLANLGTGQRSLRTIEGSGGLFHEDPAPGFQPDWSKLFVLPSRRWFEHRFSSSTIDRAMYMAQNRDRLLTRGPALNSFPYRLRFALRQKERFNALLGQIIHPVPNWSIDRGHDNNWHIKLFGDGVQFLSDGLGDGIVSLFFIVDALYDSDDSCIVAIDEPELSLHPVLQRRLSAVLNEYSKSRQIIVATHSPYFLDLSALAAGARLFRVFAPEGRSRVARLSDDSIVALAGLLEDQNNPHVMGLDAREAFFLDDGIILVEGQEDVLAYRRAFAQLDIDVPGHFFGWGVGGASKMRVIASILRDLGFTRVVGLLDADQQDTQHALENEFPEYLFETIPAVDVRTKPEIKARSAREGLLDENGNIRHKYEHAFRVIAEKTRRAVLM